MAHPPADSAASETHKRRILLGSTASMGIMHLGASICGMSRNSLNLSPHISCNSGSSSTSQSSPLRQLLSSFNCSLYGSHNPTGSYISANFDRTSLRVIFVDWSSCVTSFCVTTGNGLGFFDPRLFLLKLISLYPGLKISSLVDQL